MKKPWETCDSQGSKTKKMEAAGIETLLKTQRFRCVFNSGRKKGRTVNDSILGAIIIFLASRG